MARNSITEVTQKGFGKRLTDSIGGALFGGILFIAAFPALWLNEGRAIGEYRALQEGAGAVVHVGADAVDAGNDKKLVHVAERVEGNPAVSDDEFQVSVDGLGLRRVVEMYQWKESKESNERKKIGGGSETTTEYKYQTDWDDDAIDSSDFMHTDGHENPNDWAAQSRDFEAEHINIGAFDLSGAARSSVGQWRDLDASKALSYPGQLEQFRRLDDGVLYMGQDPAQPQVGDLRVRYQYQPEEVFSIVAQQNGNQLDSYTTSNGRSVLLVESGEMPADKMFEGAQSRNNIITWVIRIAGTLAMWLGLAMVFTPISRVLDVLPMLGTIGSWGIGLVTGLISLLLSVITIGVSWLFYRPVLGVVLIALAIGLFVWSRRRNPKTSIAVSMPPPPPMAPPPPPI